MKRRAPIRKNIWPFSDSRLSPRNTTPARGGIAKFSAGAKTKRAKAAVTFKGYRIFPHGEGFYTTPGDGTEFDTVADAKRFISDEVKMARNPGRKRRKNPADESAKAFKDFHGKPVDQFVEVKERIHTHGYLAAAGELRRLEVAGVDRHPHVISGFKGSLLAFNEKRNQLFVKGGDQSVNLADFGIKQPHELETLGAVVKIDYFADKKHLGDEGGKAIYRHKFRTTNENGKHVTIRVARYPDLIYRVLEKRLEFSGGSYEILPEGIDR